MPAGGVLRDAAVRQNLRLQVLRTAGGGSSQATRERIAALFIAGGALAAVRSAIVYCAFKEDANQLARLLGARGVSARAYHAGKDYRVGAGWGTGGQGEQGGWDGRQGQGWGAGWHGRHTERIGMQRCASPPPPPASPLMLPPLPAAPSSTPAGAVSH